jgi:uncharacterized Zn finger protein
MNMIDYYCPKCGEYSSGPIVDITPGTIEHTCSECQTVWVITIEFKEKFPEEKKAEM